MTGEMPYYDWGQDIPTSAYGTDTADVVIIGVPRAPGCTHFNPSALSSKHMCRYSVRTRYESNSADVHCTFQLRGAAEYDDDTLEIQAAPGDWDKTSGAPNVQNSFPDSGTDFDELWNRQQVLPCSLMQIAWWAVNGHAAIIGRVDGVAVGVEWDEACDAEDMPVWDWSEAAISDQYLPASSVLMMKALAETYNRIIYGSVWRIQAAIPGDESREPA